VKNKTFGNFSVDSNGYTKSDDVMMIELLSKLQQTRPCVVNPVIIFFIPMSKIRFCHILVVVYLTSETSILKAHECQKRPNLHKNKLNTTFFCLTSPLKAPNRLKSLKLV
jgi:hypothetical protein